MPSSFSVIRNDENAPRMFRCAKSDLFRWPFSEAPVSRGPVMQKKPWNAWIKASRHGESFRSLEIVKPLSEKYVRRLKRLCRMALSLAVSACEDNEKSEPPSAVYFGTGWGGMSETYDFLSKLYASDEQFTSPTDFIGSVHNAAAGHVAIRFQSTGPNVTTTGGDCSFEHALYSASLLSHDSNAPLTCHRSG